MSKRGQYFTIDAFIALVVISTGLILVIAATSYSPSPRQPEDLAEELVSSFVDQKINEINNEFLKERIKKAHDNPSYKCGITNAHNTILQQAYEFKSTCPPNSPLLCCTAEEDPPANLLLKAVADDLIPKQYGFELRIYDDLPDPSDPRIYYRLPALDPAPHQNSDIDTINRFVSKSQEETELLVSGKRLIFGKNDRTKIFWGPYDAEVRVWQ